MNAQDQTEWGRALWNMAVGISEAKLLTEHGWKLEVLNDGQGAIIDTESNVALLRAERPGVFRRNMSSPALVRHPHGYDYIPLGSELRYKTGVAFTPIHADTITAEIFHRPVRQQRVARPLETVAMSPDALWAMRTAWNTICRFTDGERERATCFQIVAGETGGTTAFVACGKVVWHLKSDNPRAFIRDPECSAAWLKLPADAAIDGTMTV